MGVRTDRIFWYLDSTAAIGRLSPCPLKSWACAGQRHLELSGEINSNRRQPLARSNRIWPPGRRGQLGLPLQLPPGASAESLYSCANSGSHLWAARKHCAGLGATDIGRVAPVPSSPVRPRPRTWHTVLVARQRHRRHCVVLWRLERLGRGLADPALADCEAEHTLQQREAQLVHCGFDVPRRTTCPQRGDVDLWEISLTPRSFAKSRNWLSADL